MEWILMDFLTALIDSLLWIKSMSTLGCSKSRKKYYITGIGCFIILLVKGFVQSYSSIRFINVTISILAIVYIFVGAVYLFDGSVCEKLVNISAFYCLLMISELIVLGMGVIFTRGNLDAILKKASGVYIFSVISKIIEALGCYWIFIKRNDRNDFYEYRERISVAIVFVSMMGNILLIYIKDKMSANTVLTFEITQIVFLWYILRTSSELKKKDRQLFELEKEVNSNEERQKLLENLAEFRHDYSVHSSIIKNMLYCKEYDKATEYAELIYKNVELFFQQRYK